MSNDYRMPRGWMDHPVFEGKKDPLCRRAAWVWLVEKAKYRDQEDPMGMTECKLKRAQVGHSIRFMAKAWGWDEAKVRRFLAKLKDCGLIDSTTDAGQTLLTIRNYDVFSPNGRKNDAPTDAASTQHRRSIDANLKERKKEEKKEEVSPPPPSGEPERDCGDEFGLLPGLAAEPAKASGRKPRKAPLFTRSEIDKLFDEFAAAYPARHKEHSWQGARTLFVSNLKKNVDPKAIISGAARYCQEVKNEGNYGTNWTKDAYNWLNEKKWVQYNGVHQFPVSEPEWKTNPRAWTDRERPPPWPDAPLGKVCGMWKKMSVSWVRWAS